MGQLVGYTNTQDSSKNAEFKYDHDANRIWMKVGNDETRFVYDGQDVVAEYLDLGGDGTIDRKRVYWNLPEIDQRIGFADISGSTTSYYYYICDQVGSVVQVVDSSGNVRNQYDYDAFGNVRWDSPLTFTNVENRYLFQGREWDAFAGHYYFRYRTYIAEYGIFCGPDRNLGNGILGEPCGMGSYIAMGNNPLSVRDPEGLDVFIEEAKDKEGQPLLVFHFLFNYVPEKGDEVSKEDLVKLAKKHKEDFEKNFNTQPFTYDGEGAPLTTVPGTKKRVEGNRLIIETVQEQGPPKYAGYRVQANVIIVSDPEEAKKVASPYSTMTISRKFSTKENAKTLSVASSQEAVFHEFVHHLNTWDEYRMKPSRAEAIRAFQESNGCPVGVGYDDYVKNRKVPPNLEQDAMAGTGERQGMSLCSRYIASALWDISNITATDKKHPQTYDLDRTHWLNASDPYFGRTYEHGGNYAEINKIIRGVK